MSVHYLRSSMIVCGDSRAGSASYHIDAVTCERCLARVFRSPEKDLLAEVRQAANDYSFLCYHTYRSDRSEKGWFDVALAKPGHPLYLAELKSASGKPTLEQTMWHNTVKQSTGIEVALWRPGDLAAIRALLRRSP